MGNPANAFLENGRPYLLQATIEESDQRITVCSSVKPPSGGGSCNNDEGISWSTEKTDSTKQTSKCSGNDDCNTYALFSYKEGGSWVDHDGDDVSGMQHAGDGSYQVYLKTGGATSFANAKVKLKMTPC